MKNYPENVCGREGQARLAGSLPMTNDDVQKEFQISKQVPQEDHISEIVLF